MKFMFTAGLGANPATVLKCSASMAMEQPMTNRDCTMTGQK